MKARDYNSACQIVNGILETSVLRLKHLKHGLSAKWIARFEKVRLAFESQGNWKNYRSLSREAPCIPCIGVTLKDLTFTLDGNPDEVEGMVNFRKFRAIREVMAASHVEQMEFLQYEYERRPQLMRAIIEVGPPLKSSGSIFVKLIFKLSCSLSL